jgi:plastocyanin
MSKNPLVLVLVGVSLILTSCSSNEKKTATINVEMLDIQFRPNEFTVPAGADVSITATNYGVARHNFIIFKKGFDAGEHFGHEDEANIYWMIELQPGQSDTQTFTAPVEPGEYFVTCGAMTHMEDGMVGKLIVVK